MTPNRLAHEKSPYLRQHADNPVDWYPWGPEALEAARREDRPILLSIGYSACHWCHVMAHESFEQPDIARRMNEGFINVKVDREERPDLDQLYQGVVQLMGQGGGWPLTVFLTPDLRPFYGGTYFPPEDKYGRPGFPRLLEALTDTWRTKRAQVESQAEAFREGLGELAGYGLDAAPSVLKPSDVARVGEAMAHLVDPVHGGFGKAPKFPNPMNVAALLRAWRRGGAEGPRDAALHTLERMALGGIYDQLGGGFHRYSVDEKWLVPHFEKMLYDNAQLLHLYAEAQQASPRPLWRKVAEETVAWLEREMTDARGGFYATQDADSEGEEGKFFVWRPHEVEALLPEEEATLVKRHLGITPQGNFEHGATVLEVAAQADVLARLAGKPQEEIEARLTRARAVLLEARARRVWPGRDDKVLAGWNGLMIRGLALAARVFEEPEWARLAARCADFVLTELWDGTTLKRAWQDGTPRIDGFLEDYGGMATGLTALYQATFEPKYLEAAAKLAGRAEALFWDAEKQAYLAAPRGQQDLIVATYALFDNATPSGASMLTEAQVALAALTGDKRFLDRADAYVRRMRQHLFESAMGFGHLLLAADALLDGAACVVLAGERGAVEPFLAEARRVYAPTVHWAYAAPGAPALMQPALEGKAPVEGQAAAYLCRDFTCERPETDPAALAAQLAPKGTA